jgi:hypothetical protein
VDIPCLALCLNYRSSCLYNALSDLWRSCLKTRRNRTAFPQERRKKQVKTSCCADIFTKNRKGKSLPCQKA